VRYVSALQDYNTFMSSQNLITKRLQLDWNDLYVYKMLLVKIVMLQKIRKNMDASHNQGHFLETGQ